MLPQIAGLKRAALDLFFPKRCVGCGREGEFLCQSCLHKVNRLFPPLCPLCGRPQLNEVLCPSCLSWQADIEGIRSPFVFNGIIREAVLRFKYKNFRAVSTLLAGLLRDYMTDYPLLADILIPVPLHPKRLRERGYNQSGMLAAELAKLTGLPVSDSSIVRKRYTLPQAKTTSVEERRRNVMGLFTCADDRIKGKKVLLIDDVATSGATLNACARALKESGAESIWGLVLAREI